MATAAVFMGEDRQLWVSQARCRGGDPDELFVRGAAQRKAATICRHCPVQLECGADALDNRVEFGVWGGMTERQRRAREALTQFLQNEAAGGYVLMAAAALALVVANTPLAGGYFSMLGHHLGLSLGPVSLNESVMHWINDGLMAVFFLLVGLEIKREVLDGQLSRPSRIILPGLAALGGVAAPALIYLAFNAANPDTRAGWAIPSATDIAFALGVLALLGDRVPTSLKIFLTAIAIMDDLAAIVIIAIFYTAQLHLGALAVSAAILLGLALQIGRAHV